jgi:hypothetical protein
MDGSICQVDIAMVDGSWQKSVAVDVYSSKYAPSIEMSRPSEMKDSSEVSATVSCLAPWDIDDNPDDNSITAFASKLPLVSYQSEDLYWTGGIAVLLLVLAYFGGILNIKRPVPIESKKQEPEIKSTTQTTPEPITETRNDDISLGEEPLPESEPESEPEPEVMVEPEEEIIDIDDSTASGRLSVLRMEIKTDTKAKPETEEDISSRLDSFFADR